MTYVCMYVCMYVCTYVRTYVRTYVCMYVCKTVYNLYNCMCISKYTHTYLSMFIHALLNFWREPLGKQPYLVVKSSCYEPQSTALFLDSSGSIAMTGLIMLVVRTFP